MPIVRFHLHIENLSAQDTTFHITPAVFERALAGKAGLANKVRPSFGLDSDTFDREIGSAHGLVGWRFPVDDLSARAPHLAFVHLTGAGLEHLLPLDWVPSGVALTNNRGVHAEKAREFATMAILMLNSRMPLLASNQRAHRWEKVFTPSVRGKTLLVVGVGNMGGAAAKAGKALGMRVLGVRRSAKPHRAVDEMHGPADLPALLPHADIVILAAPATPETAEIIGRRELDLMKPEAGILNIGRAKLVDHAALAGKLRSGELSGAILDVFSPEPLPGDSELWDTPRLMLTPHCSSDDRDTYALKTAELALRNVERQLSGKPLLNRVRRHLGY